MVKDFLNNVKDELLDCLYPEDLKCFNCNKELNEEKYLCKTCLEGFTKIKYACEKCGNPVNSQTLMCDGCKNKERFFDKAISPYEYDKTAQSLIYKLKYNAEKYISKVFAESLVNCFLNANLGEIDFVTCIPLNEKRLKERGYNQAEEISKQFVKALKEKNVDLIENYNMVKRVKNTPTQTDLTKQERKHNLENAFELCCDKKIIKGKTVLIVDDIFTTGATMEEIAKVLKKAKAEKVFCLTVCHTNINRLRLVK